MVGFIGCCRRVVGGGVPVIQHFRLVAGVGVDIVGDGLDPSVGESDVVFARCVVAVTVLRVAVVVAGVAVQNVP